jgi:RND family efflux transporter MFP subunit
MTKRALYSLAVLAVALTFGCDRGDDSPPPVNLDEAVTVETAQVASALTGEPVTYSGTVEPAEKANIATKIMGQIDTLFVKEGDEVREGNPLVKLRSQEVEANLAQADAGIAEAKVHYDNAKKNLERFQSLYARKTATQKELEDMQAAYASAEARYQVALQNRKQVEDLLQYVLLTAPFDGVVTQKYMGVGDLATPGQPILSVENTDYVKISAMVPETGIQALTVAMPVKVSIPANAGSPYAEEPAAGKPSNREFDAYIHQILPSADPASHQFEIKILTRNPGGTIRAGMFARVGIVKQGEQTLTVPTAAVFHRGPLDGVFVVDSDGRARLRWVRVGRVIADRIEVVSGLDEGETVVVHAGGRLRDGQKVAMGG